MGVLGVPWDTPILGFTGMEHLDFLEFLEETRTAEQAPGWKLGIIYNFIFWNTSIEIPNDAPG